MEGGAMSRMRHNPYYLASRIMEDDARRFAERKEPMTLIELADRCEAEGLIAEIDGDNMRALIFAADAHEGEPPLAIADLR
jgi:hypothetical protein